MAIWFLSDAGQQAMGGALTATSLLTAVTAGAANVVGTWVVMHTNTAFPVSGFDITLGKVGIATAATNTQTLLDVGTAPTGAAANSEVPIAQDIAIGGALAFASWRLPLSIPIASRISVRIRSVVASKSVTMGMMVYGGGMGVESGYRATTYGQVTATSRGTVLTAPTSINTVEAPWTVLSAATTSSMRWMLVGLTAPNNAVATAADLLVDIGVGPAATEAAVLTDIPCSVSANEDIACPRPLLFPVSIPTASRLVARYRGNSIAVAATPTLTVTGIS
jgi:hypothetical protein